MINISTSIDLRRWAENCQRLANNRLAGSEERTRFRKMTVSLEVLAEQQDWLEGVRPVAAAA